MFILFPSEPYNPRAADTAFAAEARAAAKAGFDVAYYGHEELVGDELAEAVRGVPREGAAACFARG